MAPPGSGKQRASRIQLGYHKRPDRLFVTKFRLSVAAAIAAIAYASWTFLWPGSGVLAFSHGPVAEVHATWDAKCNACHEPFVPIRGDAWSATLPDLLTGKRSVRGEAPDQKCQACHLGTAHQ